MARHMALEQLAEFIDGRLSQAEHDVVRRHLDSGCRECNAHLAWLQRVLRAILTDRSAEPPAAVIERGLRIMEYADRATELQRPRTRPGALSITWR